MNEITTTAMVLSVMPIGEYDRRIELLSSDLGRISAFARGARRPGSNLISVTRVFAFGVFTLYQGKKSYSIRSARISHYFDELTSDMNHVYFGFYFLEVAQYFSRENLKAQEELKLLYYSLRALNSEALDNYLVKSIYELKMLVINGLCPPLDTLAGNTGQFPFIQHISAGCLRAMSHVISSPAEKLFRFVLSEEVQTEFSGIVTNLLRLETDRQFKSEKMLEPL